MHKTLLPCLVCALVKEKPGDGGVPVSIFHEQMSAEVCSTVSSGRSLKLNTLLLRVVTAALQCFYLFISPRRPGKTGL